MVRFKTSLQAQSLDLLDGNITLGGDVTLYRSASNTLKTDDVFLVDSSLIVNSGTTLYAVSGPALSVGRTASNPSIQLGLDAYGILDANGASGLWLQYYTNKNLGLCYGGGNVTIGTAAANGKLNLPDHTTAAGGVYLGSDVTLYRAAANVLKTDDTLVSAVSLMAGTSSTTPNARLYLQDLGMSYGVLAAFHTDDSGPTAWAVYNDGVSTTTAVLSCWSANGGNAYLGNENPRHLIFYTGGWSANRMAIKGTGEVSITNRLVFGPLDAEDVNLYRSIANLLKTDNNFAASTLQSTATSGAPLIVASSAVVTNLNADTVDGKHAYELGGVPTSRSVSTASPLTGGGSLASDLNLGISAATQATAGSMSAVDKLKLDNASASATANSLALRNASGGTNFTTIAATGITDHISYQKLQVLDFGLERAGVGHTLNFQIMGALADEGSGVAWNAISNRWDVTLSVDNYTAKWNADSILDVPITAPVTGKYMTYNGSQMVWDTPVAGSSLPSPAGLPDGYVLQVQTVGGVKTWMAGYLQLTA